MTRCWVGTGSHDKWVGTMLRPLVGLVLLVHGNSGWWAPANATDPPEGPWKAWARTKSLASKYLSTRYINECCHTGCKRLGKASALGVNVCWAHEQEGIGRRSRSRSQDRRPRADSGDGRERDRDHEGSPPGEGQRVPDGGYQRLLDELKEMRESLPKEKDGEEQPRRKRLASKSPGVTPKSSVHRSLARLGMLDSPDGGDHRNWLEEFFERYTQGRDVGLSENQVRRAMAEEKGMGISELSRVLHRLGSTEQSRGQKGLTKFLSKWKVDFEDEEDGALGASDASSIPRSWSVLNSESPGKVSTPPGLAETPPQVLEKSGTPLAIGAPTIYGKGDRRAGAASGSGADPMAALAQAIQSQTAEIASLVKAQTEVSSHPQGSVKGINRLSEEMVYIMRACDQYNVAVCPGEVGGALANALMAAQIGAATKLRAMGFRQRMTQRLAVGIAGPYWGSQEKFCLGASDFIHYTDAELDAFATDRQVKTGVEQRPAVPTKLEEWTARARRQNQVWCLVYGAEWKEVREHALETLTEWHQECPHKWPLTVVMDAWEELHWRFLEEVKELIRALKKVAKRESMSQQEMKFYALLPGPDGRAWLSLPNTFDIKNLEGWFKTELEPRIERRQERTLWRLTWDGGRRDRGQPAGGVQSAGQAAGGDGGQ